MPGLLNQMTGAALPLTASDVTSFVSGYALGLTASLTYGNLEAQSFQGKDPSSILNPRPTRVADGHWARPGPSPSLGFLTCKMGYYFHPAGLKAVASRVRV